MERISVPILQERQDWPGYERKMVNLAKRYGRVSEALVKMAEPKFEIKSSSTRASSVDGGIELEEAKTVIKERSEYQTNKIEFTGIIMESLSPVMEASIRSEAHFESWYNDNDYLSIWKALKDLCIKSVMSDVDDIKYQIWQTKQRESTFEEYVLKLEHYMKVLKDSNEMISESDLVLLFIKGLDKNRYHELVAEIGSAKGTADYPDSYVKAKERVRIWGKLRGVEAKIEPKFEPRTAFVSKSERTGKFKCFRCGGDHHVRECDIKRHEAKCSVCGKDGHLAKACWKLKHTIAKAMVARDIEDEESYVVY
jgi:hypothetical protein